MVLNHKGQSVSNIANALIRLRAKSVHHAEELNQLLYKKSGPDEGNMKAAELSDMLAELHGMRATVEREQCF